MKATKTTVTTKTIFTCKGEGARSAKVTRVSPNYSEDRFEVSNGKDFAGVRQVESTHRTSYDAIRRATEITCF